MVDARVLRRRPAWVFAIAALVLVGVAARVALPYAIERYLDSLLARNPSYTGRVGHVNVDLYRGAYQIRDVAIEKRAARVPVPFLSAPVIDVSVEWHTVIHGALVAEVVLQKPEINFVAGPTQADRQSGVDGEWKSLVEKLAPTKINRFEVQDGKLRFRNFHSEPKVDVSLVHLDLVAENLAKVRGANERRPARLDVRGDFEKAGRAVLRASLDPSAKQPTFDLDFVAKDVPLAQWNDFLRAYARLDVEKGELALYAELLAKDGEFRGYVKPFLKDVEVLDWSDELERQSLVSSAWEAFVQGLVDLFKNRQEDDVATRIPLTGRVAPRGEFWPALGNAVYNAFVEGLAPQLEHSVGASHSRGPS